MSARPTLDSMLFARAGERLSGAAPVANLPRLVDGLVSDEGSVEYRLQGGTEYGRPILRLAVEATVVLRCQYCLEPYRQLLKIERILPLARDEAELARWERDDPLLDALIAEPALDVLALVEDEILLSLPVVPRHPEGGCGKTED